MLNFVGSNSRFFFPISSSNLCFIAVKETLCDDKIFFLISDEEARISLKAFNYFLGKVTNDRNSLRVTAFSLKIPFIALVTVEDSCLCTPRVVMHW